MRRRKNNDYDYHQALKSYTIKKLFEFMIEENELAEDDKDTMSEEEQGVRLYRLKQKIQLLRDLQYQLDRRPLFQQVTRVLFFQGGDWTTKIVAATWWLSSGCLIVTTIQMISKLINH